MARKSLRPQLNQIRAWKQQGRTDAWIAHQLEVSATQLREFTRRNSLEGGDDAGTGEVDLRDEIEAEIEAAEAAEAERKELQTERGDDGPGGEGDGSDGEADGEPRRRRRRRRGGRGRGRRRRRPGAGMEASFEHGDGDKGGYGLWLDDSIKDDPIYAEHWVEQTDLRVTFEPDRIVLERPPDQQRADDEEEDHGDGDGAGNGSDANVGDEDDE